MARIVDVGCLRPYRGEARPRIGAVAQALANGTADGWARTLIHAYLRAELCKEASLQFDERGWPTLMQTYRA